MLTCFVGERGGRENEGMGRGENEGKERGKKWRGRERVCVGGADIGEGLQ